jgi:hypothetical protein
LRLLIGENLGSITEQIRFDKLVLLLGICEGVRELTRHFLRRTEKYEEFVGLLNDEFNSTFGNNIAGEHVDFLLPNATIPNSGLKCCLGNPIRLGRSVGFFKYQFQYHKTYPRKQAVPQKETWPL